jgi:hypothetical protein
MLVVFVVGIARLRTTTRRMHRGWRLQVQVIAAAQRHEGLEFEKCLYCDAILSSTGGLCLDFS